MPRGTADAAARAARQIGNVVGASSRARAHHETCDERARTFSRYSSERSPPVRRASPEFVVFALPVHPAFLSRVALPRAASSDARDDGAVDDTPSTPKRFCTSTTCVVASMTMAGAGTARRSGPRSRTPLLGFPFAATVSIAEPSVKGWPLSVRGRGGGTQR